MIVMINEFFTFEVICQESVDEAQDQHMPVFSWLSTYYTGQHGKHKLKSTVGQLVEYHIGVGPPESSEECTEEVGNGSIQNADA